MKEELQEQTWKKYSKAKGHKEVTEGCFPGAREIGEI